MKEESELQKELRERREKEASEETEFVGCQDCGRIIYYDKDMKEPVTSIDDFSAPPYVTESGDLFCCLCGPAYDEPDDEEEDFVFEGETQ